MTNRNRYQAIESLAEVLPLFSSQSVVVMHSAFAEPAGLAAQLAEYADRLRGVQIYTLMSMGDIPYLPPANAVAANIDAKQPDGFSLTTFFPGSKIRQAINDGRARLQPTYLSAIAGLFERGQIKADFLFLQLSPPDEQGNLSLGLSVDYMRAVMAQKPIIIAEINPQMPRTSGDTIISADQIDYVIEATQPPQSMAVAGFDEVDDKIAANVASLLDDGVVLQLGIGAIPDLTLAKIGHLQYIGIHSGIITQSLMPLMQAGVISNATKKEFTGKVVTTMAGGTPEFYEFLDNNTDFSFQPSSYTHNFDVLAKIDRLFAINSVLQIDLNGRANAEKIGDRIISSAGGLPDFARGATASKGGASIIAMRSMTRRGDVSCIVRDLPASTPVSINSDHIDYVVTEFGTARLRGLSASARAKALIAIAHPDYRDELGRQA